MSDLDFTREDIDALNQTADAISRACGSKAIGAVRVVGPAGTFYVNASDSDIFYSLAKRIEDALFPF